MKVAVVVQRYGLEVIGGAESHARLLIGELRKRLPWEFEVFTSCASDYRTWANHYPAGSSTFEDILVHRYPTRFTRPLTLFSALSRLLFFWLRFVRRGWFIPIPEFLESIWVKLQGPYCPDLVSELKARQSDFNFVLCFTYLYYPTLAAATEISLPILLVPTAHREPPFYFRTVKRLFNRADVIAANGKPEEDLILSNLPHISQKIIPVGVGISFAEASTASELSPVALYMGRISEGKGINELLRFWENGRIQERYGLTLQLAGTVEPSVSLNELTQAGVEHIGFVQEDVKFRTLSGASLVINPSPHESLSLLVLEALFAGTPVLCTERCEVFRYYATEIPLCITYSDAEDFEKKVAEILQMRKNTSRFGEQQQISRHWVRSHYSWDAVTEKFRNIAQQLTEGSTSK